jgi:hypothetical protein
LTPLRPLVMRPYRFEKNSVWSAIETAISNALKSIKLYLEVVA